MGTINKNIWWNISEIGTIDMDILMNYFRNGKLERSRRIFDKIFQKWERSQCRSCTNAIQPMKTKQIRNSRRVTTIFTFLLFFTCLSIQMKVTKRWLISSEVVWLLITITSGESDGLKIQRQDGQVGMAKENIAKCTTGPRHQVLTPYWAF